VNSGEILLIFSLSKILSRTEDLKILLAHPVHYNIALRYSWARPQNMEGNLGALFCNALWNTYVRTLLQRSCESGYHVLSASNI